MLYLVNAFSINMLPRDVHNLRFIPVDVATAALEIRTVFEQGGEVFNAIGHPSTDAIVRRMLSEYGAQVVPGQRANVALKHGDELIVAQYRGPRLPEGAVELPPGAVIEFWSVSSA